MGVPRRRALVLVHGAWHGAWSWDRVTARLVAHGVDVQTPTLAGLAERRDELDPAVGLRTHVDDVVAVLDAADGPVVLAGHSYAGLVVREAADRRPGAVARLVMIDGWTGADGASLLGLAPEWMSTAITTAAAQRGDGWRIPPPDPALVGVEDPADVAMLRSRLTDQPLATFTDATRLTGAVDRIPTSAVTADPSLLPFRQWASAAGWPTTPIRAGHDLMLTAPRALASVLLEAVAGQGDWRATSAASRASISPDVRPRSVRTSTVCSPTPGRCSDGPPSASGPHRSNGPICSKPPQSAVS